VAPCQEIRNKYLIVRFLKSHNLSYVILSSQLLSNANEMSLRLILSFATCRELMCVLVQDWIWPGFAVIRSTFQLWE
jgi:hypothetical protein